MSRAASHHLHSYDVGNTDDHIVGGTLVCGKCGRVIYPGECALIITVPMYCAKIVVEDVEAGAQALMRQWGIDNPLSTRGSSD